MQKSKKRALVLVIPRLCLVAEVGFEPHDLRVMSPTSYQAALLRDILLSSHSQGLLYHTFVLLSTPFLLFVQKFVFFAFLLPL